MKKSIILLMSLFSIAVIAQETKHLDFKGVSIDGDIKTFVSKMEEKGFVKERETDQAVIMKGKFVGKSAELFVLNTSRTNVVWKVAVYLDKDASWSTLKSDYYEYVKLFTTKYGKPSDHFEFFSKPYYEGDGYELQALRKEKCTYSTFFKTPQGTIAVAISKFGEIRLIYEDSTNADLMVSEKNKSNLDDI